MEKKEVPKDLQIFGLILAIILTASLVEQGGDLDGGLKVFIKTLPMTAIGIVVCKLVRRKEFFWPRSWPEWIIGYFLCTLIGGMVVLPFRLWLD